MKIPSPSHQISTSPGWRFAELHATMPRSWKEAFTMVQAQQQQLPEHMRGTPPAIIQVIAGLIFAVLMAAMTWGLVKYF